MVVEFNLKPEIFVAFQKFEFFMVEFEMILYLEKLAFL